MSIKITTEQNWDQNFTSINESIYKVRKGIPITYATQIIDNLKNLDDDDDFDAINAASILCKVFGYRTVSDISELRVIKLIANDDISLSIKIAVPHPSSLDKCIVGTFILNSAMNIIGADKVETLQRKVSRLPLFRVPETAYHGLMFKENISPNATSQMSDNSAFMERANKSCRLLPNCDELLALIEKSPDASDKKRIVP